MPRFLRVRDCRGFSFPEALVVIALIGMGLIVAIPAINQRIRAANVRTSADQFTMTLRAARMMSVAQHRPVEVRLVPVGSGNYYEYQDASGENHRFELPVGATIHPASARSVLVQLNGSIAAGPRTVYIETEMADGTQRWAVHTNVIGVTTVSHQTLP